MQARIQGMAALALLIWTSQGRADDELIWRPAAPRPTAAGAGRAAISLGQPEPLRPVSYQSAPQDSPAFVPVATRLLVRGQVADPMPPPPPPPPPPPGGIGGPVNPGEEAFNCGVANTPTAGGAGGGGFWSKFCDRIKGAWDDVTGSVKTSGKRTLFQSDHAFDVFISPVSNPFYFEDPRALTEVRPLFIWQHTPSSNPIFAGGNNFFFGARGGVAFTDWLSITVDELGLDSINPRNPQGGFRAATGLSELHLGPKVTFIRNETSGTVAAAGLIFELASGSSHVFQATHNMGLTPYFSIAQNFGRSQYGSFNFMNTDGYSHGFGDPRGDMFYASFHLDYDVGNLKKIYPLIEVNWANYTHGGTAEPTNFEGRDLFHFGSNTVHGLNELTLALGARYKISESLQLGLVGEFNTLGGSRHLDGFRMTFDVIFRY